jgi:hypothetical protein
MPKKDDRYALLTDYLKGRLSGDKKREFEQLLDKDPELKRTAGFVADLIKEAREIQWHKFKDPAHSVFRSLLRDFKSSERDTDKKRGIVFFDSQQMPPPEGIRPATTNTRRIKYRIGDEILEISLYPVSPNSYELIGLISGRVPGDILKVEIRSGKSIKRIESNDFQLFRIERIESGRHKLKITAENEVIAKIDIEL